MDLKRLSRCRENPAGCKLPLRGSGDRERRKLIANNKTRFQKEIHGNRGKGCPVFVKEWPDPLAETKAITEELRDYHQMGIAYEDMAVLYRTNQGPRLLIERMMEYNIPFHMRGYSAKSL